MAPVAPYGRWPSPLPETVAAAGRRALADLASDGASLYWLERKPEDRGHQVVVRARPDGIGEVVSPPGVSVRSSVHEYGGGAWCLLGEERIAYVDHADQRVYACALRASGDMVASGGGEVEVGLALTPPAPPDARWCHGDLHATPAGRVVLAVRERLEPIGPARELVAIDAGGSGAIVVLWRGPDFVAAPRLEPGGRRLAWIAWSHPDMPWDASDVWVGDVVEQGGGLPSIRNARRIDGGRGARASPPADRDGADRDVSVGQPLWCRDGSLVYASDADGWWQPWRWRDGHRPERLSADEAEVHTPDWALGQQSIVELADGRLLLRRRRDGADGLAVLEPASGASQAVAQPCVSIGTVCGHGDGVAWIGATACTPAGVWACTGAELEAVDSPGNDDAAPHTLHAVEIAPGQVVLGPEEVSVASPFSFEAEGGRTVHGLFYPPHRVGWEAPDGELPPLVVLCHSGPTGCADPAFDPIVQLCTTRGFALAAVDYAGSTGYGRAYRRSLDGRWGEADADDYARAVLHLAAAGLVDATRAAIRGTSAGGFTALCAMARTTVFVGAVSWYGVTDLFALSAATHDFESRYNDRLVGPLPDAADEYRRRSPLNRVGDISGAVLLFQGTDDPIVPRAQAESMAAALAGRGVPVELVVFEGEGHGFRNAEHVAVALRAEMAFYQALLARA